MRGFRMVRGFATVVLGATVMVIPMAPQAASAQAAPSQNAPLTGGIRTR